MTPLAAHRHTKVYTLALAFECAKFAPRIGHRGSADHRALPRGNGTYRKGGMRDRHQAVKDKLINAGLTFKGFYTSSFFRCGAAYRTANKAGSRQESALLGIVEGYSSAAAGPKNS